MKRVKRNKTERAHKLGYNQGLKGHAKEICPFAAPQRRAQWLGGWREGHAAFVAGYHSYL